MKQLNKFKPLSLSESIAFVINDPGKDFESYSPEVVRIIDDYVSGGNYPYNQEIEDICANTIFRGLTNDDPRPLSRIVYNSQSYRHARIEQERIEKLESEGFLPSLNNALDSVIGKYKWFTVIKKGQNFLGFTVHSENKMKLVKANDRYYWMKPRARSRGIPADPTQFFKPL